MSGPHNKSIVFTSVDNNYSDKLNNEGCELFLLGQEYSAKEYFDQAILLDNNVGYYFYNRGLVFYYLGQFESAINDYETAILLDDTESIFYYENFLAKIRSHRIYSNADVLKLLDKAIELEKYDCPKKVDYLESRSKLVRSMGRSLQADNDLKESNRIRWFPKPSEKYPAAKFPEREKYPGTSKRFKEMMETFGEEYLHNWKKEQCE